MGTKLLCKIINVKASMHLTNAMHLMERGAKQPEFMLWNVLAQPQVRNELLTLVFKQFSENPLQGKDREHCYEYGLSLHGIFLQ